MSGITQIGSAAWQSCHQLQIVKLPPSVVCLQDGVFQGCYVLRQVAAPGCVQFSRRVFAECCSLSGVGTDNEATNELAPGAQLGPFAFESCLALTSITFVMDRTNTSRALPDGSFCGSRPHKSLPSSTTFNLLARRPVRTANGWWKLISCARTSLPSGALLLRIVLP